MRLADEFRAFAVDADAWHRAFDEAADLAERYESAIFTMSSRLQALIDCREDMNARALGGDPYAVAAVAAFDRAISIWKGTT